jgi:hypothetical protein
MYNYKYKSALVTLMHGIKKANPIRAATAAAGK